MFGIGLANEIIQTAELGFRHFWTKFSKNYYSAQAKKMFKTAERKIIRKPVIAEKEKKGLGGKLPWFWRILVSGRG